MLERFGRMARRIEPVAYFSLRVVSGLMFSVHGVQKVFGFLAKNPPPAFGSQMWIGGLIELIAGVAIAVGFYTRPFAFLASGTMAVAYTQFHWKLQLAGWKWLPSQNMGEMALLYCFVFFFIFAHGAGIGTLGKKGN